MITINLFTQMKNMVKNLQIMNNTRKNLALHKNKILLFCALFFAQSSSFNIHHSLMTNFHSDFEKIWLSTEKYNYNHEIAKLALLLDKHQINDEYEQKVLDSLPAHLKSNAKIWLKPVIQLSVHYHLDPLWVISVIWTESNFLFNAASPKGAIGLMQMLPKTAKGLIQEFRAKGNVFESEKGMWRVQELLPFILISGEQQFFIKKLNHIELGIYYLKSLLNLFNGNMIYATVAYNMGPYWTKQQVKINNSQNSHRYWKKVNHAYVYLSHQIQ
jgi:hypothetical protein